MNQTFRHGPELQIGFLTSLRITFTTPQFASTVCWLRLTIFFWALMQVVETWILQTRHLGFAAAEFFSLCPTGFWMQVLSSMHQDDCVRFPRT